GGSCEPDRSGNLGRHVGQYVAIEIRHNDDVEGCRRIGQFRRADIDNPVLFFDVRIFGADLVVDLVEETVGHLHDVVLREAGDLLTAILFRVFEGETHNFLATRARNELEALHHVARELVLDARVKVFLVFTHDQHVHAGMFRVDIRSVSNAGPDVRVEAEPLARGDVEALVAAPLRRGDGSFIEHLGTAQGLPRTGIDTRAVAAKIN